MGSCELEGTSAFESAGIGTGRYIPAAAPLSAACWPLRSCVPVGAGMLACFIAGSVGVSSSSGGGWTGGRPVVGTWAWLSGVSGGGWTGGRPVVGTWAWLSGVSGGGWTGGRPGVGTWAWLSGVSGGGWTGGRPGGGTWAWVREGAGGGWSGGGAGAAAGSSWPA